MAAGKRGAPSKYSATRAEKICNEIMDGRSLRSICTDPGMPDKSTVMRWLASNDEFVALYTAAKAIQAEGFADELIAIADTPQEGTKIVKKGRKVEVTTGDMIDHRKLQISSRQWVIERILSKKYGTKIQQEITGRDGGPVVIAGAPSDADL